MISIFAEVGLYIALDHHNLRLVDYIKTTI